MLFLGDSTIIFNTNTAKIGGAMYYKDNLYLLFENSSRVKFYHNFATDGGALHFGNSNV